MIAAVIGSRTFNDYEKLKNFINTINKQMKITKIISGGARGADTLAEQFAAEHFIPIEIIKPDWKAYGKAAAIYRNYQIVNKADIVIAFWDGKSKGTKSSIDYAKQQGKRVEIIYYMEN